MRLVPIFALLFPWLLFEPGFHDMRPEQAVISITAAVLAAVLFPMSFSNARLRPALSALGAVLVLSTFYLSDNLTVTVSHVLCGAVLLLAGLAPKPVITYTDVREPVTSSAQALLHEPQPGSA